MATMTSSMLNVRTIIKDVSRKVGESLDSRQFKEIFDDSAENILQLIEALLQLNWKSLEDKRLLYEVVRGCCVWAVDLLHEGQFGQCRSCLSMIQQVLPTLDGLDDGATDNDDFRLHFMDVRDGRVITVALLTDLCPVLRAACYMRQGEHSRARDVLRGENATWRPHSLYLQACSWHAEGAVDSSLSVLHQLAPSDFATTSTKLRVKLLNLAASCLSHQGKSECCIDKLRESLVEDFSHLHSLYLLAVEYGRLHLIDAHLECLRLLCQALEKREETGEIKSATMQPVIEDLILSCDRSETSVQLHHAMYLLAKSCLRHARYDEAAEAYKRVIHYLTKSTHLSEADGDCMTVPSPHQIYSEACLSALRCGRYHDCVAMATEYLDQSREGVCVLQRDDADVSILSGSKWTNFREYLTVSERRDRLTSEARLWMYRSDGLRHMEKYESAVSDISQAINILEAKKNQQQSDSETEILAQKSEKEMRDCDDVDRGVTDNLDDALVDCYCQLGSLRRKTGEMTSAIHSYRLALQVQAGNVKVMYDVTTALMEIGRVKEAVIGWLQFRGVTRRMDSFQLGGEIKRLKNQIRSSKGLEDKAVDENGIEEEKLLTMDMEALGHLMCHTTR